MGVRVVVVVGNVVVVADIGTYLVLILFVSCFHYWPLHLVVDDVL